MIESAVEFVKSKWALLTAEGKTIATVSLIAGFVVGVLVG